MTRIIPACAGSTPKVTFPRRTGEGSSPRARGAHLPRTAPTADPRIIPACAGSTARFQSSGARPTDHPRVRGEHGRWEEHTNVRIGSSPRARGARGRAG